MKEENLFVREYNNANKISVKSDLDISDECEFSFLDILKEKEVEVLSKTYSECSCVSSVNFSSYYNKCEKCAGSGRIELNGNQVICNHCNGKGYVIKEVCPLCNGEGKIITRGKVVIKLNDKLKNNDVIVVSNKGKESNGIVGDLFIKVIIKDRECFEIINNDIYDKRMIKFSKEDLNKGVSKQVETIKGFAKIKSSCEEEKEVVRLIGEGVNGGDYYICLNNELTPIRGNDVYKNVIVDKDRLGFYIMKSELFSDVKCLSVDYYRKINDFSCVYIDLKEANNFKVVKIKEKGTKGKNGGVNGDLFLRVYFSDEFVCVDDKLFHKPVKLNKYEIYDGKKVVEYGKEKIVLNFTKNIDDLVSVRVEDYGFLVDKNKFENAYFVVNPFAYDVFKVSVKISKKDKVIYLKEYKKYFNELVSFNYNEGLKVEVSKKDNVVEVKDENGDKVIVNIIR